MGTLLVTLAAGIAMAQVEPGGRTGTPPGAIDCVTDGENRCEGAGQPDIIICSPGRDIVNASQGDRDDVFGNKGDDTLGVQDEEANDFVNCGEGGEDQAFGDHGDKSTNCGGNVLRGGMA